MCCFAWRPSGKATAGAKLRVSMCFGRLSGFVSQNRARKAARRGTIVSRLRRRAGPQFPDSHRQFVSKLLKIRNTSGPARGIMKLAIYWMPTVSQVLWNCATGVLGINSRGQDAPVRR